LFSKTTDSDPVDDNFSDWLVRHFRGTGWTGAALDPSHVKEANQRGSDSRNGTDGRHRNDMLTGRGLPRRALSLSHRTPELSTSRTNQIRKS
jgi:hypothetical protein